MGDWNDVLDPTIDLEWEASWKAGNPSFIDAVGKFDLFYRYQVDQPMREMWMWELK